ncbi:hypothetical protein BGZ93_000040 [Podila epicladia]|nr:hypothetical protein BGZ93_000040 [Podila epicladia]
MTNSDKNPGDKETYVLYCNEKPGTVTLLNAGATKSFKVPLIKVMIDDTFTSTYIEGVSNNTIARMLGDWSQYALVDAAFRMNQGPAQLKDIWMPHNEDMEPLARADYIRAVSLFFNQGQRGEEVYNKIKSAYETHKNNMAAVPQNFKRRIGWIKYDFDLGRWTLRNSNFTRAIIRDAGGISFPLSGDSFQDNLLLTEPEVKLIILNSNVLIDETKYPSHLDGMTNIRKNAGFAAAEEIPVLVNSQVYSLDYTRNEIGSVDYNYRVAGRPDLLLKDMIRAQYSTYSPSIGDNSLPYFTFFNVKYGNGGTGGEIFTAAKCNMPEPFQYNDAPYTSDDIMTIPAGQFFSYNPAPAPPTGGGIYGSYDGTPSGNGGEGKKSNVGIIVGVVVAAVVMAAGFAFAFFKWGKRAKEDRFIELEEEMNNEIPMH